MRALRLVLSLVLRLVLSLVRRLVLSLALQLQAVTLAGLPSSLSSNSERNSHRP